MTEPLVFTTAKRRHETIKFMLDGEKFEFDPPKQARLQMPLLDDEGKSEVEVLLDWFSEGLPDERVQRLWDRLNAPRGEDDFDIPDLVKIARGLVKASGGRPTT